MGAHVIQNPKSKIKNSKRASLRRTHVHPTNSLSKSEAARRYLVGGVNSPVRAFRHVGAEPLLLVQGRGARVVDHQGNAFLDCIMGWGALLFGHNAPEVVRAIRSALSRSTLVGLTHPDEGELARLIAESVPSVECVRFTVSGTEACMTAVRLARAQTKRSNILMTDGSYHGHSDSLMAGLPAAPTTGATRAAQAGKTAGLPDEIARQTITVPYNDPGAIEDAVHRIGKELACVIVEPVAANMGVIAPASGYLAHIRQLTRECGALLVFDEVVTGFRLGRGGAQGAFGVTPDLTTFGKIIGGGLPIGALGGPASLMQRLAPEGDVYHGGTFAGHPLSMAAGIAVLRRLVTDPPYARLETMSRRLADGLLDAARRVRVPMQINRVGSLLTVFFSDHPVRNAADAGASDKRRFAQWANGLRREGMLIPPSPFEALCISTAHTATQIDRCISASRRVLTALGTS